MAEGGTWTANDVKLAEERRCAAMISADIAELQSIFAQDACWIHSSGKVDDRADFIEKIHSKASEYLSIALSATTTRIYGLVAISSGIATMEALANGEPKSLQNRFTNVWVLQDGVRLLVSAQSTKVV